MSRRHILLWRQQGSFMLLKLFPHTEKQRNDSTNRCFSYKATECQSGTSIWRVFAKKKKKEKRVWQENCTASSSLELNLNLNWCHHLPFNAQSELPWVSKDKCNSTIFLYIPATVFLFLFVWGFLALPDTLWIHNHLLVKRFPAKKL